MNLEYEAVPNIISGKDLDYLSDMFNWNYGAYKCTNNSVNEVNDKEIKNMLENCSNTFFDTMPKILDILNNGRSNE